MDSIRKGQWDSVYGKGCHGEVEEEFYESKIPRASGTVKKELTPVIVIAWDFGGRIDYFNIYICVAHHQTGCSISSESSIFTTMQVSNT